MKDIKQGNLSPTESSKKIQLILIQRNQCLDNTHSSYKRKLMFKIHLYFEGTVSRKDILCKSYKAFHKFY